MNAFSFLLVLAGVFLNAASQLLLKAGANAVGTISIVPGQLLRVLPILACQPHILGGLVCCVLSVGIWIVVLSRVEVGLAYPMLSIGYVVNAIAARYLFGEALSLTRLVGIAVILVGVVIISRS